MRLCCKCFPTLELDPNDGLYLNNRVPLSNIWIDELIKMREQLVRLKNGQLRSTTDNRKNETFIEKLIYPEIQSWSSLNMEIMINLLDKEIKNLTEVSGMSEETVRSVYLNGRTLRLRTMAELRR